MSSELRGGVPGASGPAAATFDGIGLRHAGDHEAMARSQRVSVAVVGCGHAPLTGGSEVQPAAPRPVRAPRRERGEPRQPRTRRRRSSQVPNRHVRRGPSWRDSGRPATGRTAAGRACRAATNLLRTSPRQDPTVRRAPSRSDRASARRRPALTRRGCRTGGAAAALCPQRSVAVPEPAIGDVRRWLGVRELRNPPFAAGGPPAAA